MNDQTQPTAAVPTPEKNKRQMSFTVLPDTGDIRADFGPGLEPIQFAPSSLPEAIWASAMAEGLMSRLRGYTSKLADNNRTPENLRAAIAKGLENLRAGVWTVQREPGLGEISIEAEAAHIYRKMKFEAENPGQEYTGTLADDAAAFAALADDKKATLKKVARYQAAYAQVKASRAAKKAEKLAKKADADDDTGF